MERMQCPFAIDSRKMVKRLQNTNYLAIICDRKKLSIDIRTILYIQMHENMAEIHTSGGKVYKSLITLERLESTLGDLFLKVHRSRLVSVMAIHDITDKVNLNNGERLGYVARRKKELTAALAEKLRTRRTLRGNTRADRPQPGDRHVSENHLLPDPAGTLWLPAFRHCRDEIRGGQR